MLNLFKNKYTCFHIEGYLTIKQDKSIMNINNTRRIENKFRHILLKNKKRVICTCFT